MFQRRLAEPFGLELVIAVREARIGGPHGGDQRIDHLALDAVGEMRASATSLNPRQRSEISLSFAKVLATRLKVRRFSFKPAPKAMAAFSRVFSCGSCIRLSTGSIARVSPSTVKRKLAIVSSKSRFRRRNQ